MYFNLDDSFPNVSVWSCSELNWMHSIVPCIPGNKEELFGYHEIGMHMQIKFNRKKRLCSQYAKISQIITFL
jgi:hypothetical protein